MRASGRNRSLHRLRRHLFARFFDAEGRPGDRLDNRKGRVERSDVGRSPGRSRKPTISRPTGHHVLDYVGGTMSPEMQLPELLWRSAICLRPGPRHPLWLGRPVSFTLPFGQRMDTMKPAHPKNILGYRSERIAAAESILLTVTWLKIQLVISVFSSVNRCYKQSTLPLLNSGIAKIMSFGECRCFSTTTYV